MRKKLSLLIITLILCVFTIPNVFAASATTQLSGTNKIKVGKTTTVYVKLKASDIIKGADVTYKTSGNIKVTKVSIGSGLSKMGQNGNRYILYSSDGVKSGSTILALTVKGTAVGKGTLTVTMLEATVSGVTVSGGSKSYTITVVDDTTSSSNTTNKNTDDNKKTTTDDSNAKEEARKKAENKAKELVEQAEKTLKDDDYDAAKKAVDALSDSTLKKDLTKRLDEVKFKIAVNKEVEKRCGNSNNTPEKCEDKCDETECNSKSWIILCIILFICLLLETIYLIARLNKKERYE